MSLIHVTSENFEKALQAAPGVAVVDFFATWCGPCKMLAPVIEEIQFYKVDVDEAPELARSFKVMSVPTLAFFKNGELVKKNVGAVSYEELEELINSVK
jgi:thioredoxin 1